MSNNDPPESMLEVIHMELQETNKLLRLLVEQQAAVSAGAHDLLSKYDREAKG
jgi:hypothetical protein